MPAIDQRTHQAALDGFPRFSRSFRAPGLCGLDGVAQIIRTRRVADSHFAFHVMDATRLFKRLSFRKKIRSSSRRVAESHLAPGIRVRARARKMMRLCDSATLYIVKFYRIRESGKPRNAIEEANVCWPVAALFDLPGFRKLTTAPGATLLATIEDGRRTTRRCAADWQSHGPNIRRPWPKSIGSHFGRDDSRGKLARSIASRAIAKLG
jgi:hypothetical protein